MGVWMKAEPCALVFATCRWMIPGLLPFIWSLVLMKVYSVLPLISLAGCSCLMRTEKLAVCVAFVAATQLQVRWRRTGFAGSVPDVAARYRDGPHHSSQHPRKPLSDQVLRLLWRGVFRSCLPRCHTVHSRAFSNCLLAAVIPADPVSSRTNARAGRGLLRHAPLDVLDADRCAEASISNDMLAAAPVLVFYVREVCVITAQLCVCGL